jgi:isoleucyl-tRNA synthetase
MFRIAEAFVRWIAPVLAFTADEIWKHLPGERPGNVLFATFYDGLAPLPAEAVLSADAFGRLLQMREAVSKVLEPMRADGAIGASLEAEVDVLLNPEAMATFAPVADELRFFFITSRFEMKPVQAERTQAPWIHAVSTSHGKCVRCWHYRADVGSHADDPALCGRCVENVSGGGESRRFF